MLLNSLKTINIALPCNHCNYPIKMLCCFLSCRAYEYTLMFWLRLCKALCFLSIQAVVLLQTDFKMQTAVLSLSHSFFLYLACMTAQNILLSIKVAMEQAACQISSSAKKQSDDNVGSVYQQSMFIVFSMA